MNKVNPIRKKGVRRVMTTFIAVFLVIAITASGGWSGRAVAAEQKLQVVATFSIVYDIVRVVGGEHVEVHSMVPLGQDPHEFTPLPLDIRRATDADVLFWNGLDMELGDGWFEDLLIVAGKQLGADNVVALADGISPLMLTDGLQMEQNPHAYLSVPNAMQYVRNARDGLRRIDPDNAAAYTANAAELLAELEQLHEDYRQKLDRLPAERRILVTAERAFQYVAAEYGLQEGYLWAIDTDEQGTPQQIVDLIQFVRTNDVPALFLESNVNPRGMETVSRETGVPIVGKVYSDELGRADEAGGTLVGMLRWNLDTIYAGLSGNK